jgi:hypothetical protein
MTFKKILTGTIAAAALVTATFAMTGEASAKNHKHHGHRWYGGPVFVIGGADYVSDCYMVKKYTRTGRPYLVEVCS